jgi:hypothetical protein
MDVRFSVAAAAAWSVVVFSGCGSIVSGRHSTVKIDSNPQQAQVSIRDDQGQVVANAITPAQVPLKRGRSWLRPAKYTAQIEKPGYQPAVVPIQYQLNPWVFGNIVFGALPGLAIDAASGAAWKPKNDEIAQNLVPLGYYGEQNAVAGMTPPMQRQTPTRVQTASRNAPMMK